MQRSAQEEHTKVRIERRKNESACIPELRTGPGQNKVFYIPTDNEMIAAYTKAVSGIDIVPTIPTGLRRQ